LLHAEQHTKVDAERYAKLMLSAMLTDMTNTTEHEHCLAPGCGRRLFCKTSRARGYGWGCWRRIRAAAKVEALAAKLAVFTARQIESALEAIEDCAVIPAAVIGWFHVVSTDGSEVYEGTAQSCPCPASAECWHRAAMIMATA
jgi:hypothetical protein